MRGATIVDYLHRDTIRISIHAPHAGCDARMQGRRDFTQNFNPRTPCGVRPTIRQTQSWRTYYFNPRTPCGVRHPARQAHTCAYLFQSTHPMRGATLLGDFLHVSNQFQSTHPMRGATSSSDTPFIVYVLFQSTHPMRGATSPPPAIPFAVAFQSTHPMRGATWLS